MEENAVATNPSSPSVSENPMSKRTFINKKKKLLILAIAIIVLVAGTVFILSKHTSRQSATHVAFDQNDLQETSDNTTEKKNNECSTDFGMITAPRESATGAFTAALTDVSSVNVISPGKLVGDARFTYLWIKGSQRVPVFAPADGTLVQIFYKTRSDLSADMSKPDYDLVFLVDCHTFYRINHITDPVAELVSQTPITTPLQLKPGSGFNNNDIRPKQNITVKAGQQIGTTTGTPAAHNFDFGIFVDGQAICPYDKFSEPIRSNFLSLLGNTSIPISGTTCDVSGSY